MYFVSMLGNFQITDCETTLTDEAIRSDMTVKLLAYILMHREGELTVQELSEALWQEDETENPAGALKNLMYRLRGTLKEAFGEESFILTNRGAYRWNPEIEVAVDAEEFEKCCSRAKSCDNDEEKTDLYEQAEKYYQGDLLPKCSDMRWIIPLSAYYHSMFLTCAKNLAELCANAKNYPEMERVCTKALVYDSLDEQLHYYLIKSMICQNKIDLAMSYCKKAEDILYSALGVRNSAKIDEVRKELLGMQKTSEAAKIDEIHQDLLEEKEPDGAYICGYQVFKEMYRLEARRIKRLGLAEYVLLVTLSVDEDSKIKENIQLEKFVFTKAMTTLEGVLRAALRVGDVAARYSDTQFVVLLPTCTYESVNMVAERIYSRFFAENKNRAITISGEIEEVTTSTLFEGGIRR